jgi:CRP-like cAMP-binding protein
MAQHAFAKGQVLVRQGEAGQSLYLLAEGALDVTVAPPEGPPIALDRLLPGAVFGEMSLLTGQPRSATVVAATDGEVYEIDKGHLDPILRERPSLAEALGAVMAERQARNAERRRAADLPAQPAPSRDDLMGRLRAFFKL